MSLKNDQGILLFILTGDSRQMPEHVKPQRKRLKIWKPESMAPDNYEPKKRFKRCNPANAHMDEARAWKRETKFHSHSHRIEAEARKAKYVHIMSNNQSTFTGAHRQSPCHRDFTDDERTGKVSPKVGPQHR